MRQCIDAVHRLDCAVEEVNLSERDMARVLDFDKSSIEKIRKEIVDTNISGLGALLKKRLTDTTSIGHDGIRHHDDAATFPAEDDDDDEDDSGEDDDEAVDSVDENDEVEGHDDDYE